jgi:hypothetical protein
MKNGVPFSVLFECETLESYERMAFSVTFSELEGYKYNWQTGQFDEVKSGA